MAGKDFLKNQTEKGDKPAFELSKGGIMVSPEGMQNMTGTPKECTPYGPNPQGSDLFPMSRPSGGFSKSKLATGMNQKSK